MHIFDKAKQSTIMFLIFKNNKLSSSKFAGANKEKVVITWKPTSSGWNYFHINGAIILNQTPFAYI